MDCVAVWCLHTVRGYCYWLVAGVATRTPPRERHARDSTIFLH